MSKISARACSRLFSAVGTMLCVASLVVPTFDGSEVRVAMRVVVGERERTYSTSLVARQVNLLSDALERSRDTGGEVRCAAKIRYNHQPQPAVAMMTGPNELTVRFNEPQSAITPGQAVVLYDGDVVLGGGWIETAA